MSAAPGKMDHQHAYVIPSPDSRARKRRVSRMSREVDVPVDMEPVYVWDLVVRLTHWTIVASLIVLSVTGIYIGRPFLIVEGAAGESFVMGWMKIVHFYAAIAFSLAVLSRMIWMFVGTRFAHWTELVPVSWRRRHHLVNTFMFYIFLRRKPPFTVGHNALAGLTYLVVFTLYILIILTGFALYSVSAHTSYMKMWDFLLPIFGGAQTTRWLHHVVMWLLIAFTVHHVYSAWLMSKVEKNGTMDSILSGYKFLSISELEEREREIEHDKQVRREKKEARRARRTERKAARGAGEEARTGARSETGAGHGSKATAAKAQEPTAAVETGTGGKDT